MEISASTPNVASNLPSLSSVSAKEGAPAPADGFSSSLDTDWGYGANENAYNDLILRAIAEKWSQTPPLPPLLLKSTVAQESGFNPNAVSRTGYVGLLQLGASEARSQGLSLEPVDERYIPEKNVPAGIGILAIKHGVIQRPLERYDTDFAHKVDAYYRTSGPPSDRQIFAHSLAAYNGGGATVLRAMAYAIDGGVDPREWSNLLGDRRSPLYRAVMDVYGPDRAPSKYHEMSKYPLEIIARAPL
ncbi:MAG: hypothetical protein FJX76_24555 [Armatimonadetes bacterium]|nr:hypothetical protein [Armatimonadota bacterium]